MSIYACQDLRGDERNRIASWWPMTEGYIDNVGKRSIYSNSLLGWGSVT